jgi:DNA-binding response OmpR family regulator
MEIFEQQKFPRILLIEDDTFLVGMYVKKLELEHFETLVANDGERGLALAKQTPPDLILLDILLPEMDGFLVLEELKRDPNTRGIPVILLTNLSQKKDVERGIALGANDYLIKAHFMPAEVVTKIKTIIEQTKTLRSLSR